MTACRSLLLVTLVTYALALTIPATRADDARVLPAGRFRVSVGLGTSTVVREQYDSSGKAVGLARLGGGFDLARMELRAAQLSHVDGRIGDLARALDAGFPDLRYDPAQRANGTHGVSVGGSGERLGTALSAGTLYVDADAQRQQTGVSAFYGLTSRVSVGLGVPVVRTQVRVRGAKGGVNSASDLAAFFASGQAGATDELTDGLAQVAAVNYATLQSALVAQGYEPLTDSTTTDLGDITAGARTLLYDGGRSGKWRSSLQTLVSAPTGRLKRLESFMDADVGEGTWTLGVASTQQFLPVAGVSLWNTVEGQVRKPTTRRLRAGQSPDDALPGPESEVEARWYPAPRAKLGLGGDYSFTDAWSAGLGMRWAWSGRDRYAGPRDGAVWDSKSLASSSYRNDLEVGGSWSGVPGFLKDQRGLPVDVSLKLTHPLAGRNVMRATTVAAEASLYF